MDNTNELTLEERQAIADEEQADDARREAQRGASE